MQTLSARNDALIPVDGAGVISLTLSRLESRLERIEAVMEQLISRQTSKEFYSTSEIAELLGKAEFTVREWCRQDRVNAKKRSCGRGRSQEWIISHDELQRIRSHGLLPPIR